LVFVIIGVDEEIVLVLDAVVVHVCGRGVVQVVVELVECVVVLILYLVFNVIFIVSWLVRILNMWYLTLVMT